MEKSDEKEEKQQKISFFCKKVLWGKKNTVLLRAFSTERPIRLSARTRDFHSLKSSSTLLLATK